MCNLHHYVHCFMCTQHYHTIHISSITVCIWTAFIFGHPIFFQQNNHGDDVDESRFLPPPLGLLVSGTRVLRLHGGLLASYTRNTLVRLFF